MAIIGTIRNRMGVVLVIFVGLALALFILEGLFSSSSSLFKSGNDVAKIGNHSITIQEFEQRVQQMADQYKAQAQMETLDNAMMEQIREQAWNQMLNEEIFGKEYESLGMSVSSAELFDMVQGKHIDPQIRRVFTDPKTGQFSPANVVQFLKNLDNVEEGTRNQWMALEKSLKENRIREKYNTLIGQGLYVNSLQAKQDYIDRNRTAKMRYVFQSYTTVPDNTVKITDQELKDYYNEHKNQFKQDDSRMIDFVSFDVSPSAEDKKETLDEVNKVFEEFKTAKNDSSYVIQNADTKMEPKFYKKSALPAGFDSTVFDKPAGSMIEPFLDGDRYKMAKVIAFSIRPDSVKASHILLKLNTPAEKDKVMERADSIKKALKGGASFQELAKKYSIDQGSAAKGGDLGTFAEGTMVKPFNDAAFEAKVGDMPVIETQFGIHVMKIEDQIKPSKRVKLAIIDRRLEASSKTYQAIYAQASDFASKLSAGGDFDQLATKKGVSKRQANLRESDRTLSGYESSREVIRWAYKSKENEVSKVFETTDRFIIAKLTQVREKGFAKPEQITDQLTFLVKKERKAKDMEQKLNAQINGVSSIDAVASKLGQTALSAEKITFASGGIMGVGREPALVGTLFTLKPGQLSKVIKGNAGVYVVQLDSLSEPVMPKEFSGYKQMLTENFKQRASYEVFNVLKEKAEVKDYRIKFY